MENWEKDSQWESNWWGTCQNTLGEETKQIKYAQLMGLKFFHDGKSPYNIEMNGKAILDIGGGPVSLLLKCRNVKGTVADPCNYPVWVSDRYKIAGIIFIKIKGEDLQTSEVYDEAWIYNVLQHCESVEKVIENAKKCSKIIRIFEWIDTGIAKGHPNNLTKELLDKLLGGDGKVTVLNELHLFGKAYSGIFKGAHYESRS